MVKEQLWKKITFLTTFETMRKGFVSQARGGSEVGFVRRFRRAAGVAGGWRCFFSEPSGRGRVSGGFGGTMA